MRAKGFRPFADGSREVIGVLKDWDKDGITLGRVNGESRRFRFSTLTFVKLYFDFSEWGRMNGKTPHRVLK